MQSLPLADIPDVYRHRVRQPSLHPFLDLSLLFGFYNMYLFYEHLKISVIYYKNYTCFYTVVTYVIRFIKDSGLLTQVTAQLNKS